MIRLTSIELPVVGEPGKVYSTAPRTAIGEDENRYFVKGWRDAEIAFAEVAGCRLASFVGLSVPTADTAIFETERLAAVLAVPRNIRTIAPFLNQVERIRNRSQLYEVVAVDTWLVNDDRNMGNLVGRPVGGGQVEIYMIDFEKSKALRKNPFMGSANVEPRRLWPTAELGMMIRASRPEHCPRNIINRIQGISEDELKRILAGVAEDLQVVDWHDASAEVLVRRAEQLHRRVEEVWQTI